MYTKWKQITTGLLTVLVLSSSTSIFASESGTDESAVKTPTTLTLRENKFLEAPDMGDLPKKFYYDSGIEIAYPEDGVKGIYLTSYSAGNPNKVEELLSYMDGNNLNSMVIDIKDDTGHVTADFESENEHIQKNTVDYIDDMDGLLKRLEEKQIYPIARIVAFKDSLLAENQPEMSFRYPDGRVWKAGNGEAFINPFLKETWDYAVNVGIEAAKAGFKEIQFDYVRFPEGFEVWGSDLVYEMGDYATQDTDDVTKRVDAITDFVEYAHEKLLPYGVDVSVDIFGYAATVPEAPGIGQNFSQISNHVDVISSMIYPSHWGASYFGIDRPDLHPYELVDEYMKVELPLLDSLERTPVTRPWLQDFTASYLGAGYYQNYGSAQVKAQVQALNDHGVTEFLLWNAANEYTY
ncbi:putative glycoside hydrolase [Jeotgalibaca sp. MA1X17-3]|uniref:putative glycoside hydrolase n=1 Tax=Jeotgalibaca sp. MA1X17-3 TaxID=2908211 RepID=UPI001F2EB983|nr:putative glycoside hydrolase [Jeotgalibaca sp. MA1X17-3]UJF14752.1 putative glycoside hydrolase [Jeotgalibaca sp. MA1X17-3]